MKDNVKEIFSTISVNVLLSSVCLGILFMSRIQKPQIHSAVNVAVHPLLLTPLSQNLGPNFPEIIVVIRGRV